MAVRHLSVSKYLPYEIFAFVDIWQFLIEFNLNASENALHSDYEIFDEINGISALLRKTEKRGEETINNGSSEKKFLPLMRIVPLIWRTLLTQNIELRSLFNNYHKLLKRETNRARRVVVMSQFLFFHLAYNGKIHLTWTPKFICRFDCFSNSFNTFRSPPFINSTLSFALLLLYNF